MSSENSISSISVVLRAISMPTERASEPLLAPTIPKRPRTHTGVGVGNLPWAEPCVFGSVYIEGAGIARLTEDRGARPGSPTLFSTGSHKGK